MNNLLNMFSSGSLPDPDDTPKKTDDTKKEEKKDDAAPAKPDTKKEDKSDDKKSEKDKKSDDKKSEKDKKSDDKKSDNKSAGGKKNDNKDNKKDEKKENKKKGDDEKAGDKKDNDNKDKKKAGKQDKGQGKGNKKDQSQGKGGKKGGKKKFETGSCKWFDAQKGFGFITADDGGEEIFVHNSEIVAQGFRSLQEGERVQYESFLDNGRRKARNVTGPKGVPIKGDHNKGGGKQKGGFHGGFQQGGKNNKGQGKGGKNHGGKGGKGQGFQLAKQESQESFPQNQAAGYPANHPLLLQWMAAAQAQAAWSNSWYNGGHQWY